MLIIDQMSNEVWIEVVLRTQVFKSYLLEEGELSVLKVQGACCRTVKAGAINRLCWEISSCI